MMFYAVSWAIVSTTLDADRVTSRGFLLFNASVSVAMVLAVMRDASASALLETAPDLLMLAGVVIAIHSVHRFWDLRVTSFIYVLALIAAAFVSVFGWITNNDVGRVVSACIGFSVLAGVTMWRTYAPIRREFGAAASNGLGFIVITILVSLAWRIYLSLFMGEAPNINRPSTGSEIAMFIVLMVGFAPNLLFAYFVAARLVRRANNAARSDGLTGLLNHRAFMDEADRLWQERRLRRIKGAALAVDLDFFKRINDLHGHATGDQVLLTFAQILRSVCLEGCIVGRTGGEEFVVLLAPASRTHANKLAERLMRHVKRARWVSPEGAEISLTVSIGIAFDIPTDLRPNDLLSRADAALYSAKETGRDRIVYA
jgi:diguanylate cyclase (GGDEF)-like protein